MESGGFVQSQPHLERGLQQLLRKRWSVQMADSYSGMKISEPSSGQETWRETGGASLSEGRRQGPSQHKGSCAASWERRNHGDKKRFQRWGAAVERRSTVGPTAVKLVHLTLEPGSASFLVCPNPRRVRHKEG